VSEQYKHVANKILLASIIKVAGNTKDNMIVAVNLSKFDLDAGQAA
jgi:phosphopentomutase